MKVILLIKWNPGTSQIFLNSKLPGTTNIVTFYLSANKKINSQLVGGRTLANFNCVLPDLLTKEVTILKPKNVKECKLYVDVHSYTFQNFNCKLKFERNP